jgi:uncharacterized protein YyaL (SSP411 family)
VALAGEGLAPALRGFSNSPVRWMSWSEAAFARARLENRPVYVFIGSFLSELSRNTGRESFANADTAAFFNAHFVCVLVDRDENPALAAAAQLYLNEARQVSGWPAQLWLTPELQPYDGATYLAPTEEWGQASLLQAAARAADAWRLNPAICRRTAAEALTTLRHAAAPSAGAVDPAKLAAAVEAAAQGWKAKYDSAHAGFGDLPRYPQPELLRFLLRRGAADRNLALGALRGLAAGGLRDPLTGGFFRYVSDPEGNTPYPQKTLSDQARLVLAFLDAQQASADPRFVAAARGALDYVLHHLAHADGTFASAEDGTDRVAARDERAAADDHGLLLAALARAGEVLPGTRYLDLARRLGRTAQDRFLMPNGDVRHFAGGGSVASPADYAALALGFSTLARAGKDEEAAALADRLLSRCDLLFLESKAGIYGACPAELPAGVFARAPAYILAGTGPSPESLALQAGAAPETANALVRGLARRLADDGTASGDTLLALPAF